VADNTTLPGTGDVIATDDVGGIKHQLVKVEFGAADSATQVSPANPLPVSAVGDVAHDGVDSGNVVKIGSKAIVGAAAGGLPTAVAGSDRVQALMDVYGRQAMRRNDSWSALHAPAAAAAATISKAAAGAGIRNVCTSITISLASAAAPTVGVVTFNLRDGATGAGTILWTTRLSLPATAGQCIPVSLTDIWIEGSANTAMTLETSAAAPANVQATVCMTGTLTQ